MSRAAKILEAARANPAGLTFGELQSLVTAVGFVLVRHNGSHHVYKRSGVVEIINLQPKGNSAKRYQVEQVLEIVDRYGLVVQ